MAIRIFNNLASVNAQRLLGINNQRLAQSVERISSGIRINRGADDAAGLAISAPLNAPVRSVDAAAGDANDGISLVQTAQGGLSEIESALVRLRELAVQLCPWLIRPT